MIKLTNETIDRADINALIEWLSQDPIPQLSKGQLTKEFEKKWAKFIGTKYSIFCNSGSSANLLMLYSLIASKKLKNDKVVVPSLAWATDLSPVMQFNLTPILCDINLENLSVSLTHLEEIFKTESPSVLLLVSVLGLSPEMDKVVELCKKFDVILLEDCCEAFNTKFNNTTLGNFGLMSSYSMFFSHHLCTIEGGMVSTNDDEMYKFLLMLRSHGWSRDLTPEQQTELKEKWNISDFNNLYTFYTCGFNLRSTDLQAFIGLRQLDKAEDICQKRHDNFYKLQAGIKNNYWKPSPSDNSWTSSFCYPIIHPKRDEIVKALNLAGIDNRPLISGSMGIQPMYIEKYGKLVLPNVSVVDNYGLYIPNHHQLLDSEINLMCDTINKVINS